MTTAATEVRVFDDGMHIAAELVEMSRFGAIVVVGDSFAVDSQVLIEFQKAAVSLTATVEWCRPEPDGRWLVTCAFEPLPCEEALKQLRAAGELERRRQPREPVDLPVQVKWQLNHSCKVRLRDLSADGLCLVSPRHALRGQRLLLELGGHGPALVDVQWVADCSDGHLIGCTLANRQSFAAICHWLAEQRANGTIKATAIGRVRL